MITARFHPEVTSVLSRLRASTIGLFLCSLIAGRADAADPGHPAVVELFQSQGCSSCPPADAVLNDIAGRSDLIALSFAVTYWDSLGWKDSFAQRAFTQRQYDYASFAGRSDVWTPQMVVNGVGVLIGDDDESVEAAITRYDRPSDGPQISVLGPKLTIGKASTAGKAVVWLVRYDPRTIDVPIHAGENNGRTIPHRNIVRQLIALGTWTGASADFTLPSATAGLESAVLVQIGGVGPIIAATKI